MKRRPSIPISQEEKKIIQQSLKDGLSIYAIAGKLNRSGTVVWYEINKGGGRDSYSIEISNKTAREVSPLTLKVEELRQDRSEGMTIRQMAQKYGSSTSWMRDFLCRREIRAPEFISGKTQATLLDLEKRIEVTEMQLEIVIEQLKTLTEKIKGVSLDVGNKENNGLQHIQKAREQ